MTKRRRQSKQSKARKARQPDGNGIATTGSATAPPAPFEAGRIAPPSVDLPQSNSAPQLRFPQDHALPAADGAPGQTKAPPRKGILACLRGCMWSSGIREEMVAGAYVIAIVAASFMLTQAMDRREVRKERVEDYLLSRHEHMDALEASFSGVMNKTQAYAQLLVSEQLSMAFLRVYRDPSGQPVEKLPTDGRTFEDIYASWVEHRKAWLIDLEHYESVCSRALAEIQAAEIDLEPQEGSWLAKDIKAANAFVAAARDVIAVWFKFQDAEAGHVAEQADDVVRRLDSLLISIGAGGQGDGTADKNECPANAECRQRMARLSGAVSTKANKQEAAGKSPGKAGGSQAVASGQQENVEEDPCILHKLRKTAEDIAKECKALCTGGVGCTCPPGTNHARGAYIRANELQQLMEKTARQLTNAAVASIRLVNNARLKRIRNKPID